MRRKDREITDLDRILAIIGRCRVCRVAFFDGAYPYVVPLNFGAEVSDGRVVLYFHSAAAGKKLDLMKRCPRVAFEMDNPGAFSEGADACDSSMAYESVCGIGTLEMVPEEEKLPGLLSLMRHYSEKSPVEFVFNDSDLREVVVLKLMVKEITGKRSKGE